MARTRIDSVIDIQKIEGEFESLNGLLGSLMKRLQDPKYRLAIEGTNDLKVLLDSQQKLTDQQKIAAQQADKYVSSLRQLTTESQRLAQTERQATSDLQKSTQTRKEAAKAAADEAAAKKIAAQAARDEAAAKRETAKQAAAEAKIAEELTNEYRLLGKSLQDAEVRYKNLALSVGFEAEATKEALDQALAIRGVLDKLDGNLRNYQRNVGNYKSAFDGLGFSFTQIARELPSLSISASQFFLAISNNLPMVFDEVGKARKEISAIKAQGEETPGLFKRVTSSIFSLNVGLSVAVALFTAFGGKIIEAAGDLLGFTDGTEKLRQALIRVQQAQLELIKSTEEFNQLFTEPVTGVDRLEAQLRVYRDLNKSTSDQLELEKRLNAERALNAQADFERTGGRTKLAELEFQLRDAVSTYQGLVELVANTENEGARKYNQNLLDQAKVRLDLIKEQYSEQKKIVKEYNDSLNDYQSAQNRIEVFLAEEKRKKILQAATIEANTVIDLNERVLNNERSTQSQRIKAIEAVAEAFRRRSRAEQDAIRSTPSNRNQDGSLTQDAQTQIQNINQAIEKSNKDSQERIFKVNEDYRKRREQAELDTLKSNLELRGNINQAISEDESKSFAKRIDAFAEYYAGLRTIIIAEANFKKSTQVLTDEELLALDTETKNKLLENERQYRERAGAIFVDAQKQQLTLTQSIDNLALAREKLRLQKSGASAQKIADAEYEAQKQQLNNTILINEEILVSNKTTDQQKLQARIDLNKALADLDNLEFNRQKGIADQTKQLYLSLVSEIKETVFSVIFSAYDKQIQDLQRRQQDLQRSTEAQINLVNQLGLSEAERIRETARIQKQAAFENEIIEQRRRKLARERAIFEKAQAVTNIIQSTAVSYMEQIGKNPIFAQIILAIGALQLARVIAQPLPQYKTGRGKGKKELAITGDGGVPEYILRGDTGAIEQTPAKPTLTQLMADDIVFKDKAAMLQYFARLNNQTAKHINGSGSHNDIYGQLMLHELKGLNRKEPAQIFIHNHAPIESSGWYQKMIKG